MCSIVLEVVFAIMFSTGSVSFLFVFIKWQFTSLNLNGCFLHGYTSVKHYISSDVISDLYLGNCDFRCSTAWRQALIPSTLALLTA